jgi:hypothetical protein
VVKQRLVEMMRQKLNKGKTQGSQSMEIVMSHETNSIIIEGLGTSNESLKNCDQGPRVPVYKDNYQ